MVAEKLQSLFSFKDAPVVFTNDVYHFSIRQVRLPEKNCQLLFTDGLSDFTQPVNDSNQQLKHIELYFMLPDFWDLSKKKWPVDWLNRIASVPQKNKTWFGIG